ncbi:MAG: FeoB-associated Cys-rich membrane protein [Actinomycetia bacterium]|nr:FeoB-associated Cys-rich membrane protein [Actinomycetes bacterium]
MSHATSSLLLNVGLILVVLLVAGLALGALIKQRRRKKPLSCIGCPQSGSCSQRTCTQGKK